MSSPASDPNRKKLEDLARLGWYHSIELPDGRVIPGYQSIDVLRRRAAQFPLPVDLHGRRVLDIGAWDGWFSFEMERRGAQVVSVDSTAFERYRVAHDLLGSKAEYRIADVCRLTPAGLGYFDIVLFLGVLYHLKHPMLALEKVCELSTDLVCVESFVTDDGSDPSAKPLMEFYETTELCGQFDNWVGPNVACLLAMCRAAGFASVKLESVLDHRAHVTCHRRWPEPAARAAQPAPYLTSVGNAAAGDPDYVSMWFKSSEAHLTPAEVLPRIGPYGSHPVFLESTGGDGWQVNCKIPPGLAPGWHPATVRTGASGWSNPVRIGVGVNGVERRQPSHPEAVDIRIAVVTDGKTWERNLVHTGLYGCLSLWVSGLPGEVAAEDVTVRLSDVEMPAVFLSQPDPQGLRQINALLRGDARPGDYSASVRCGGAVSPPAPVRLV